MANQYTYDPDTEPKCTTEEGKKWRIRYLNMRRTNRKTSELLKQEKMKRKEDYQRLADKQKEILELKKVMNKASSLLKK